jgi:hypothetical protein
MPEVEPMENAGKQKPPADSRPDPSKQIFSGQVVRSAGENGFIACEEIKAMYQRDAYMWKTYFGRCSMGDYVRFQIHVSDRGLPQVCWLEKIRSGGWMDAPEAVQQRPEVEPMASMPEVEPMESMPEVEPQRSFFPAAQAFADAAAPAGLRATVPKTQSIRPKLFYQPLQGRPESGIEIESRLSQNQFADTIDSALEDALATTEEGAADEPNIDQLIKRELD